MFGGILNNRAAVIDGKRKRKVRNLGWKRAVSAQVSGRYAAVILYRDNTVRLYRSLTGEYLGRIGRKGASNIDLQENFLAVTYKDDSIGVYDLKQHVSTSSEELQKTIVDLVSEYILGSQKNGDFPHNP